MKHGLKGGCIVSRWKTMAAHDCHIQVKYNMQSSQEQFTCHFNIENLHTKTNKYLTHKTLIIVITILGIE